MKIAIISGIFFPEPGGAQVQVHNLANKLVEQGHQVDCYIYRQTNIKNNKYNIIKINYFLSSMTFFIYYYLGFQTNFFLNFFFKKKAEKKKYDYWYFSFLNFKSLLIISALKNLNQKIAVCFQGVDIQIEKNINYGYRLNKKYEDLLKITIDKINVFFSISNNIYEDLVGLNINKDKIFLVPNAVEIKKFLSEKESKEKILKFITVARFAEKKKGLDIIKKIASLLIDKKIQFKWLIIGKDSDKLLKNKFFENNKIYFELIANIENLDESYYPNSKLIKIYKSCNLYLNLARIESFGITIIEALASELPVITFDTKGGNELIVNNMNGNVVEENNLNNYVEAILMHKNINYYKRIKSNTIKSINKFDLTGVARDTTNILEENLKSLN